MTEALILCSRCSNPHYCIMFGTNLGYCKACFDTVSNDLETKESIKKLMDQYGIGACDVEV